MSILFLTSGLSKLAAPTPTKSYMESHGVPGYLLYPAASLEIGGGTFLVLGFGLRWLGQVLAGWCMLTAMIFHTKFADPEQKINFMKNLAMAGGFLVLAGTATVGGDLSLLQRKRKIQSRLAQAMYRLRGRAGPIALPAEGEHLHGRADLMEKGVPAITDCEPFATAKKEITALFSSYHTALIASDTPAVMSLYAPDSRLMAQGFPSVVGWSNIKSWYTECFKRISLDVTFEVNEVVVVNEEYGFASTTSKGRQKDLATGKETAEGNHELFVVRRGEGGWRVARYCFSSTE
jgi:uncharacterized protein (TIGR02246 family)